MKNQGGRVSGRPVAYYRIQLSAGKASVVYQVKSFQMISC